MPTDDEHRIVGDDWKEMQRLDWFNKRAQLAFEMIEAALPGQQIRELHLCDLARSYLKYLLRDLPPERKLFYKGIRWKLVESTPLNKIVILYEDPDCAGRRRKLFWKILTIPEEVKKKRRKSK